jgi:para-nitrobenzyl esterase
MNKTYLSHLVAPLGFCLALGCSDDATPSNANPSNSDGGSDAAAGTIQTGTDISLAAGKIEGAVAGGTRHFFGIPYAEPPVGSLRFRAPVKKAAWNDVLPATELPKRCAQPTSLNTGEGTDNEDCLYLNVWTPEPAPSKPLPVLVWIHGGGNQNGATSDLVPGNPTLLFYNGQSFAEHRGVVMVSLNYRLGVFGYLSHSKLREEGSPSGNQGLLDQRNVTIFGESAGARNVCFHVVSPGSKGLFHRAISESGDCTGTTRIQTRAESEGTAFAEAVGCTTAADALSCLRDKPAAELIIQDQFDGATAGAVGGSAYNGGTPRWDFRPVVDGDVVPRLPRDLFRDGEIAKVPYIMGTNTEEGGLAHLTAPKAETEADYLAALDRRFGTFAARVAATYPASSFPNPNDALIRVSTDERYACAVQDFAERATAAGLPVYAYNFNVGYAIPQLQALGPAHGAELTYVFASLADDPTAAGSEAVSDLLQKYWARFATSGDPNGDGAPEWSKFAADRQNRLDIDADPQPVENFRAEQCALWREYYDTLF